MSESKSEVRAGSFDSNNARQEEAQDQTVLGVALEELEVTDSEDEVGLEELEVTEPEDMEYAIAALVRNDVYSIKVTEDAYTGMEADQLDHFLRALKESKGLEELDIEGIYEGGRGEFIENAIGFATSLCEVLKEKVTVHQFRYHGLGTSILLAGLLECSHLKSLSLVATLCFLHHTLPVNTNENQGRKCQLEFLDLRLVTLHNDFLQNLASFESIESLVLDNVMYDTSLGAKEMQSLLEMPKLKALDLRNILLKKSAIEAVASSKLEEFTFGYDEDYPIERAEDQTVEVALKKTEMDADFVPLLEPNQTLRKIICVTKYAGELATIPERLKAIALRNIRYRHEQEVQILLEYFPNVLVETVVKYLYLEPVEVKSICPPLTFDNSASFWNALSRQHRLHGALIESAVKPHTSAAGPAQKRQKVDHVEEEPAPIAPTSDVPSISARL